MDALFHTGWPKSVLTNRRDHGSQLWIRQTEVIEQSDPTFMERPDDSNMSTQDSSDASTLSRVCRNDEVTNLPSSLLQFERLLCVDEDSYFQSCAAVTASAEVP